MMKKWIETDERSELVGGRLAMIFLTLTQLGLLGAIFFQRYLLDRDPAYYNDLAIIFGYSVLGFMIGLFFFGGLLPRLSIGRLAIYYVILVSGIGIPYLLIRGWPTPDILPAWLLVIFGGPLAIIAIYGTAAYLGQRRIESLSRGNGSELN